MRRFQELQVILDTGARREVVGTVAIGEGRTYFEYEAAWQRRGIELAPFKLPVRQGTFQFSTASLLNGLPGLCADSLPDGWGMLIMDRFFLRKGVRRSEISPLDRLAYLGDDAMGALCYHPADDSGDRTVEAVDIGHAAREAYELYEGRIEQASSLLAKIGGSPGGARPKALVGISDCGTRFVSGIDSLPDGYSHWLVKFTAPKAGSDRPFGIHEGVLEYLYLQAASDAGITVPEFRLITDEVGLRHIAVRRFDRPGGNRRIHMATAYGLLHASHQMPSLDYDQLLTLAWSLARDIGQVREQFRRAAFNLFALNRDDHSKNHGYLMDDSGAWRLSPAYDLTYSEGPGGEHWTAYQGEGRNPSVAQLRGLASAASIEERHCEDDIRQVRAALERLPQEFKKWKIPRKHAQSILDRLQEVAQ